MSLRLEIEQGDSEWTFRLFRQDKQLLPSTKVPPEPKLYQLYRDWRNAYLSYYGSPQFNQSISLPRAETEFRITVEGGTESIPQDWRSTLVETTDALQTELDKWLDHDKLKGIRKQIAEEAEKEARREIDSQNRYVEVLLTLSCCDEFNRLPWERWAIREVLATPVQVRISRSSISSSDEFFSHPRWGKNRVLVILGDETGLNFRSEREALRSLSSIADIDFVGWQPGRKTEDVIAQIRDKLTDSRGWDVLIFLGHSNEAKRMGGKIGITPDTSIFIDEIEAELRTARERGLQFAVFNSCSGLDIAQSLVKLGFNQVVVMREPIHHQVAQKFLVKFLEEMNGYHKETRQYHDVHEALQATCGFLTQLGPNYPSVNLIPSLFRHPDAELFRFRQFGIPHCVASWVKPWLPATRYQAIALSGLVLLSMLFPVQSSLLGQRGRLQAVYRRFTGQISTTVSPPVVVVQIDQASLRRAGIADNPYPIDRAYFATLIDRLSALDAKVIGIDYVLDLQTDPKADEQLAQSIQSSVARQGTWFVFATTYEDGRWTPVLPEGVNVPEPAHWSLQGRVTVPGCNPGLECNPTLMELVYPEDLDEAMIESENEFPRLPFTYLLALAHQFSMAESGLSKPQPNLQSQKLLQQELLDYLSQEGHDSTTVVSPRAHLQNITALSYWLRQAWLHPIIDFSVPPEQVYQTIPAWQVLDDDDSQPQLPISLKQRVVIIAAGGYKEAGLDFERDSVNLPAAVRHWRFWQGDRSNLETITGGEVHAYMLEQLLTQRLVVPIPDLWMIGVAALLGQGTVLALQKRSIQHHRRAMFLIGATAVYGIISLQVYISATILLPWLLPSVAFWIYVFPLLRKQPRG